MSWKHSVWRAVSALRESAMGPSEVRGGLRVLCYHSVGPALHGDPYGLSVDPASFRRQMELVAGGRFGRPVSLGGARIDGSPEIAVTFDDGFRDTLTTAAPILAALKLPFTVAVTAAFVRDGEPPHMRVADLRELSRVPGAEIGAHGAGHRLMAGCGDDELARELSESRAFLAEALGAPAEVMTWPHGSASRRTAEFARRAGFVRAGCSLYGLNEPGRDPLLLKRTEITGFDSDADFVRKCSGGWDWFALRQGDPASR
jgi:peptidoglycan/xylan/chitin deacetylase (PgdA/CDA1 family)